MKRAAILLIAACFVLQVKSAALEYEYANDGYGYDQQDLSSGYDGHGYAYEQPALEFIDAQPPAEYPAEEEVPLAPNYDLADFVYNPTNYYPEDRVKHYELGSKKKSARSGPVKRLKLRSRKAKKCNENNVNDVEEPQPDRPVDRRLTEYSEVEANEEYFTQ